MAVSGSNLSCLWQNLFNCEHGHGWILCIQKVNLKQYIFLNLPRKSLSNQLSSLVPPR